MTTAVSNFPTRFASVSDDSLPGMLVDQLAEAVVFPPDPYARSAAVAGLVVEMFEAIRGLHGPNPDQEELGSMYRVVAEALAHRSRMVTHASGECP